MRKLLLSLALVALSFTACKEKAEQVETQILQADPEFAIGDQTQQEAEPTSFNQVALQTNFVTTQGDNVTLKDILDKVKGSPALIDIWATWCPDCIKAMEPASELKKQFPNTKYIYLSLDKTNEKWIEGIEKYNLQGENYFLSDTKGMKGDFGKSIDLNWIPRYIVVDKDSNIVLYRATEKSFDQIKETLTKLN